MNVYFYFLTSCKVKLLHLTFMNGFKYIQNSIDRCLIINRMQMYCVDKIIYG